MFWSTIVQRVRLAGLSAVLLAAVTLPAWGQSHSTIEKVTKPQIAAALQDKVTRTVAEQKMASQILDALAESESGQVNGLAPRLKAGPLPFSQTGVNVVIRTVPVPGEDLLPAIAAKGVVVRTDGKDITAQVPLKDLPGLAHRPDVLTINPVRAPVLHRDAGWPGRIAREGLIAHAVDPALVSKFGATGAGVTVCVISDSLDDRSKQLFPAAVAEGAVPQSVRVLPGQEGPQWGSAEGLAMLQIVHAIAPKAELWFSSGFDGQHQMAANIRALAQKGCHVIVDDLTYPEESPFQDGPISGAVQDVSDRGVLYFSSAGNSGNQHHRTSAVWEGDFNDGGEAGGEYGGKGRIHMWRSGITLNTVDSADGTGIELYWSDPLAQSTNSYDIYVVNAKGEVVRKSDSSRVPGADPYQYVPFVGQGESIVVVKADDAEPRFLHLSVGRSRLRHATGGSVRGHNASAAANAFSVAAKGVGRRPAAFQGGGRETVRDYSSDGPRRMFYKADGAPYTLGDVSATGGRLVYKPDLTAADGVTTTLPEGTLNPFVGTSAAAPHAAGIAALLLSCTPRPTAAQVREALQSTALVLGDAQSNIAGYGVIRAGAAVEKACNPLTQVANVAAATDALSQTSLRSPQ